MTEETKRVDRRKFLKGAVVAGLGAVAGGALAGCGGAAPAPTAAPAKPAAEPTKAAAAAPTVAKAAWPEKGRAVTFLVPMSAGSGTDIGARMVAAGLEKALGVPFNVVNKTGASGIPAYTELVKAKPDGYTLVCWTFMSGISAYLDPELKATYTRKDIQPVAHMLLERNLLIVDAKAKWNTMQELLADAKANPGKIRFGNSGILANLHITALMLEKVAGVQFAHVQFPGAGDAVTAMYGGNIDCTVVGGSMMVGPYKNGQVKLLAVTDREENEYFPGIKTLQSMGYDVVAPNSTGIGAPAGTPKEIVQTISQALKGIYSDAAFSAKLKDMALTKAYMDSDEFSKAIDDWEARMKPIIQEFRAKAKA